MPSGLIQDQNGMRAGLDLAADDSKMLGHGMGVAIGHDQSGALAPDRTDGAEYIGPFGALIVRRARPRSPPRPPARDLVLLTDPCFVLKPDFYRLATALDANVGGDGAEVFLNASIASASCA